MPEHDPACLTSLSKLLRQVGEPHGSEGRAQHALLLERERPASVQLQARLASGQGGVRVVSRFVVVVLHIQVGQLGVLDPANIE